MTSYDSKQYSLYKRVFLALPAAILTGVLTVGMPAINPSNNLSRHLRNPSPEDLENGYKRAVAFVRQYRETIIHFWQSYGIVPPEMLAATIISENQKRQAYEDLFDRLGTGNTARFWDYFIVPNVSRISFFGYKHRVFCGTDTSLGAGQVQISRAQSLNRRFNLEQRDRAELELLLTNPEKNITYLYFDLAELINRDNRMPSDGTGFFDNPKLAGVIYTEHKRGSTSSSLQDAQPNQEGLDLIGLIAETDFRNTFGDYTTIREEQKAAMREFLKQKKLFAAKTKKSAIKSPPSHGRRKC